MRAYAKKSAMVEIVRRLRRIFWKEINCGIHGTRGRRTGRKSFFRVFRLFRGQSFLPPVAALSLCGPCILCGWPTALSRLNPRLRTVQISAVDLQLLGGVRTKYLHNAARIRYAARMAESSRGKAVQKLCSDPVRHGGLTGLDLRIGSHAKDAAE